MAAEIDPETMARIEELRRELAECDYPKVWIGEEGITAEELLELQMHNYEERRAAWEEMDAAGRAETWREIPEADRMGIEEPPESWDALPEAVQEGLRSWLEIEPGTSVSLSEEDAEEGKGFGIPEPSIDWLDGHWVAEHIPEEVPDDMLVALRDNIQAIDEAKVGKVPVLLIGELEGSEYHYVPPEGLAEALEEHAVIYTAEDVQDEAENVQDKLDEYVYGGPLAYVIHDTPKARQALEQRLRDSL